MKHIYSSVDIGTDTIKVVVCELYKNRLNLLAASSVKSKGIKKGLITNVDEATKSLKKAFDEIEDMLGIKIKKVIASVPSYFSNFSIIKGKVDIENEEKIITGRDILRVIDDSKKNKSDNNEMVTIIPIDFIVDNKQLVKDPKGQVGDSLESRSVLVTTPKKNIFSVVELLTSIGVEVIDISLNSIGDIYAFRNKEIDSLVGAVVNIGSETTTVSLYNKGIPVKMAIIDMGGKNIDNDLAYMYKIDVKKANKMKERFTLAHKKYASVNDTYEVVNNYGETLKINQYESSEVVMSRIDEILNLAKHELTTMTTRKLDYIIITGGVSNMAHFEYIAEEILGKNITIGNVKLIGIRNNKFSSSVGNIVYYISKLKLSGINNTMVDSNDAEILSTTKKSLLNISNDSMLGKVFGYFFGE